MVQDLQAVSLAVQVVVLLQQVQAQQRMGLLLDLLPDSAPIPMSVMLSLKVVPAWVSVVVQVS